MLSIHLICFLLTCFFVDHCMFQISQNPTCFSPKNIHQRYQTSYTALPPCVMASSAMGLNFGVFGFCFFVTNTHAETNAKQMCSWSSGLCGVLRVFVFTLRLQGIATPNQFMIPCDPAWNQTWETWLRQAHKLNRPAEDFWSITPKHLYLHDILSLFRKKKKSKRKS